MPIYQRMSNYLFICLCFPLSFTFLFIFFFLSLFSAWSASVATHNLQLIFPILCVLRRRITCLSNKIIIRLEMFIFSSNFCVFDLVSIYWLKFQATSVKLPELNHFWPLPKRNNFLCNLPCLYLSKFNKETFKMSRTSCGL
jgi:hypothetical protein